MLPKALAASLTLLLSAALAGAAPILTDRYEISFSSIDTSYRHATEVLEFAQSDTVMVIEGPDQQQQPFEHVGFLLTATLDSDTSAGGQAKASFKDASLAITSSAGQLLAATLSSLHVEESTAPMLPTLTFTGLFAIDNWQFGWADPGAGSLFALSWQIVGPIDDFDTDDFDGESSVVMVIITEPATAVIVLAGAAVLLHRRRKRAGVTPASRPTSG